MGSWMPKGRGSWTGVGARVDRPAPAPLHPERHQEAMQAITADDAPRTDSVPEFLVDPAAGWQESGGASSPSDPGGHGGNGGGDHLAPIAPVPRRTHAPDELDYAHRDQGGHEPAELKGAGGAAKGGLRGDNARPEFNPEGFRLGNDYQAQTTMRAVWTGRMRGALRAIGFVAPETNDTSSPPPDPGGRRMRTSMFDPAAPRRGFGPERTTARHVPRPSGDEPIDAPQTIAANVMGSEFML